MISGMDTCTRRNFTQCYSCAGRLPAPGEFAMLCASCQQDRQMAAALPTLFHKLHQAVLLHTCPSVT